MVSLFVLIRISLPAGNLQPLRLPGGQPTSHAGYFRKPCFDQNISALSAAVSRPANDNDLSIFWNFTEPVWQFF